MPYAKELGNGRGDGGHGCSNRRGPQAWTKDEHPWRPSGYKHRRQKLRCASGAGGSSAEGGRQSRRHYVRTIVTAQTERRHPGNKSELGHGYAVR